MSYHFFSCYGLTSRRSLLAVPECAKLGSLRAFIPYVPHVSSCLICQRALRAHLPLLPMCLPFSRAFIFLSVLHSFIFLRALRAFLSYVPYVRSFFYSCFGCPHFLRDLLAFIFLRALRARIFSWALRTFIFLRAFTFLSVSNFWRNLCAFTFFIKCGTTHNQPLQAEISKNEVE